MGPPERQPPFPVYDSFVRPGYRLMPGPKYFYPYATGCRPWRTRWIPPIQRFSTLSISGSQFTNEFGVMPELEFAETPVGMIYIGTRRVGHNVWARMVEAILPNRPSSQIGATCCRLQRVDGDRPLRDLCLVVARLPLTGLVGIRGELGGRHDGAIGPPRGRYALGFTHVAEFYEHRISVVDRHDPPAQHPTGECMLPSELVAFRDLSGTVGLLELHCPHRGASLEFGLVDAKGIRCCYHGWLFAADGAILETPGEPADSTLKDRLYHGAYPTHESGANIRRMACRGRHGSSVPSSGTSRWR
jgi:nitrite reductase/ring-hydroxylating ferredoxin subunit